MGFPLNLSCQKGLYNLIYSFHSTLKLCDSYQFYVQLLGQSVIILGQVIASPQKVLNICDLSNYNS